MYDKEVEFIAGHYRAGRFSADKGWRRLGIRPVSIWRRYRVAAAISAAVVITASAAIIFRANIATPEAPRTEVEIPAVAAGHEVKVIDFENATLTAVVERINQTYGVRVTGVPEDADGYHLSLHYEGTADDLVATINEILGTELSIEEP